MNTDELNLINQFYIDPLYIDKSLVEIVSSILSKRSSYCIDDTTQLYNVIDLTPENQLTLQSSEIIELNNFSSFDLLQYFLTYIHFKTFYQINFHPLQCSYYNTIQTYYNSFFSKSNQPITTTRMLFHFTSTPSYHIDNVVYTNLKLSIYNDRLIYMWGIFKNKDETLVARLGEDFRQIYNQAIQQNNFTIIEQNIILSQYPDFHTFFTEISGYLESTRSVLESQINNTNSFFTLRDELLTRMTEQYIFIPTQHQTNDSPSSSQHNGKNLPDKFMKSDIFSSYYSYVNNIPNNVNNEEGQKFDKQLIDTLIQNIKIITPEQINHFLYQLDYYKFPVACDAIYKCGCSYTKDIQQYSTISSSFYLYSFINLLLQMDKTNVKYIEYKLHLEEVKLPFLYQTIQNYMFKRLQPLFYSQRMKNTPYASIYQLPTINGLNIFQNDSSSSPQSVLNPNIYYPTYTLSQFYTTYKLYNRNELRRDERSSSTHSVRNNLYDLINKIIFYWSKDKKANFKQIDKIMKDATLGNDMSIFSTLKQIHQQNDPHTSFDRGAQRIRDLSSFHFFDKLTNIHNPDFKYLDFGGANGELTSSLAKHLGLFKDQVFVSDIKSWFGTENINEYQKNITLRYLKSSILPFQDNSVDFVSAFQVFHHIKELDISLKEIYRILKPNGILLIREHDCDNVATQTLIDLEHSIREICLQNINDNIQSQNPLIKDELNYLHNYDDTYFSKVDLTNRLKSFGFNELQMNYPPIRGSTRFYYNVFIK